MTSEQTAEAQRLAALWVRQHREESTAGARLTLVEEKRAKLRNETSLGYAFSASGFPRGKSYDLWLWRVLSKASVVWAGFYVDDSGKMDCLTAQAKIERRAGVACTAELEKLRTLVASSVRGERLRFALVSTDHTVRGFLDTIPFPVEQRDGRCHLSVELLSQRGDLFAIWGEGFEPGEEVALESSFAGKMEKSKQKASTLGEIGSAVFPAASGRESGLANYSAVGKSCKVAVRYEWGLSSLRKE